MKYKRTGIAAQRINATMLNLCSTWLLQGPTECPNLCYLSKHVKNRYSNVFSSKPRTTILHTQKHPKPHYQNHTVFSLRWWGESCSLAAEAYRQEALSSQLVSSPQDVFYMNVRIQYVKPTMYFFKKLHTHNSIYQKF